MQITLIFHAFFDEAEMSDGSTTKFSLYVRKRLHAKIGACIHPVTINTPSALTTVSYIRHPYEDELTAVKAESFFFLHERHVL